MPRVTINDIARIAGYSKTSVSFAFNDPSRISDRAREKILAIAGELGYVPDPVARNLTLGTHGTIGLLLPETIATAFQNSHLSQVVQGIGEVCERENHSLTLIPPRQESLLEGVRSAAVDGLITLGLEPGTDTVELIRQRHLPFVTIDGQDGGGFPVVGIDDRAAAVTAMNHVLDLGHRRIAVVCFVDEPQLTGVSPVRAARMAGYREALEALGVSVGATGAQGTAAGAQSTAAGARFWECESSMAGGREAAERILDSGDEPTAIVTMSDVIGLGVLEYLGEAGRRVPEDLSVVGFDDIPEATLVRPRLTTVSQYGMEKGRRAAEILMRLIGSEKVDGNTVLETRLVVRESSGPPVC
ncbi:MAG: substrate-binding domain-containing protein [Spirochaetes bacterium]|nr:substrate-binding domain-containing protein [Spirochaetota bacterium]